MGGFIAREVSVKEVDAHKMFLRETPTVLIGKCPLQILTFLKIFINNEHKIS